MQNEPSASEVSFCGTAQNFSSRTVDKYPMLGSDETSPEVDLVFAPEAPRTLAGDFIHWYLQKLGKRRSPAA
jgi:hypothetical protein